MPEDTTNLNDLLSKLKKAGQHPDRALLDEVKAFGQAAVGPLIEMATDEDLHDAETESPEVWAPLHAIQILGELGAAEAAEPLLPLLRRDDDWLHEQLPKVFGQIGQPALEPLRGLLFDREADVWARAAAANGLAEIAKSHPELRAEAVAVLVAWLDPKETRTPDDETVNGFLIGDLLDLKAKEALPAIRRAFGEDRVDTSIVGLDSVVEEFGLPPEPGAGRPDQEPGMRLPLRCTACGFEREHNVGTVYYDLGTSERRARGEETPYHEFVITRRIRCPKCGAVDQSELGSFAHLALMGALMRKAARRVATPPAGPLGGLLQAVKTLSSGRRPSESAPPEEEDERLVPIRFRLTDGQEMHPYAARDLLRQQVEAEPDRADLRVRYGNVLTFLGYREDAEAQFLAAVRADPANVEACLDLGQLAEEAGRPKEARRWFERVLELAPSSPVPKEKLEPWVEYAEEALADLAEPSLVVRDGVAILTDRPARPPRSGPPTTRIPPPATRPPQPIRAAPKVGRNDPCPCGSGKKYKKCCGR